MLGCQNLVLPVILTAQLQALVSQRPETVKYTCAVHAGTLLSCAASISELNMHRATLAHLYALIPTYDRCCS